MKALSLCQPWATLIALGAKTIETRSWPTSYHGPIAIHAAKGLGPVGGRRGLAEQCSQPDFSYALRNGGITRWDTLPLGVIVAVATLVRIERVVPQKRILDPSVLDFAQPELSFGDYSPGRYLWHLFNVRALNEPIPCRGALGLWTVPDMLHPDRAPAHVPPLLPGGIRR